MTAICTCGMQRIEMRLCDNGTLRGFDHAYPCTGCAHAAGFHVTCTSPVHRVPAVVPSSGFTTVAATAAAPEVNPRALHLERGEAR